MTRRNDWQLQLEAFVRERQDRPFAWGVNDCALFAADAVEALTGERVCQELRGHTSVKDAARALRAVGGVRGLASLALGQAIPVTTARIGDIVAVSTGRREALAVCNGSSAIAAGPRGMVSVPMSWAVSAWRVG